MSMSVARSLQVQLEDLLVKVELGTGAMEDVYVGHLDIVWLDRPVRARTLVSEGWPAPKPDAPAALFGTRLLRPHLLTIDFDADTVEVEPQA